MYFLLLYFTLHDFTFILLYLTLFLFSFFIYILFFIFILFSSVFPLFGKKKKYYKSSSKRFQSVPGLAAVGTSTAHSPKETFPLSNGKCAARARVPPACDGALWAISLYLVSLSAFSMGALLSKRGECGARGSVVERGAVLKSEACVGCEEARCKRPWRGREAVEACVFCGRSEFVRRERRVSGEEKVTSLAGGRTRADGVVRAVS